MGVHSICGHLPGAARSAPVLVFAAALAFAVDAAHALPAPDAEALTVLRVRTASPQQMRLVGSFGHREISRPLFDSTGVRSASWDEKTRQRPAVFLTPDAPQPAAIPTIGWSEVSEVQTSRSHAVLGGVGGFVLGIAIGGTFLFRDAVGEGEGLRNVGLGVWSVVGCSVAGTLVGSVQRWHTVYPTAEVAGP